MTRLEWTTGRPQSWAVKCPVCLSIMIKPVSPPCSHAMCLECFNTLWITNNDLCPICRASFGTWARQARVTYRLVNESLWNIIQQHFPKRLRRRLNDQDTDTDEEDESNITTPAVVSRNKTEKINKLKDSSSKSKPKQRRSKCTRTFEAPSHAMTLRPRNTPYSGANQRHCRYFLRSRVSLN